MSINVTVSGNPVRINRGKMVTTYDPEKNEFEKRRLIRLEQVRQQSKDIAENIRNRVRKEKTKCLSDVEKEGEVKLRNWQARKLLELQNQYQEALGDIGLGHKQAAIIEEDEEESVLEREETNQRMVNERGRAAAERLQIQKNEESLRKAVPVQRKKIARDLENVRASAVAGLHKNKKEPAKTKKSKQDVFDSDSENRVPRLTLESSPALSELQQSRKLDKDVSEVVKTSKEQQTSASLNKVPTTDKAAQTTNQPEKPILLDTRISDRIKRRTILNSQLDYCDYIESQSPPKPASCTCYNCCKCLANSHFHNIPEQSSEAVNTGLNQAASLKNNKTRTATTLEDDTNMRSRTENGDKSKSDVKTGTNLSETEAAAGAAPPETEKYPEKTAASQVVKPKSKFELPSKPKVTLRTQPASKVTDSRAKPVQYYNHPNRHSKVYVPKTTHVEKIEDEDLVVSPNPLTDEELMEKMRQRDIEAQVRGQVALEKEKLQKEYQDLLRKLPVLQKQERIFEIGMDKEKYHMSQDRLEELEKNRQNRLDNAYEELFVRQKPARVTLPKRKDDREEAHSLNLANWDVDFDPNQRNRSEQLSDMLSDLKSHKSKLLKEIESTLSKDASKRKYDDVKSKSTDYTRVKPRRKRSRDERPSSPTSSNLEDENVSKEKSTKKGTLVSTTGTSSPSPRKKPKLKSSKRRVLVLQNTSTQTTPKPGQSAATSPHVRTPASEIEEPCVCKKDTTALDDLCEIVIKIKEDEKPEIVVNPPFLGKSVKVITSEDKEKKDESIKNGGSWRQQLSHTSQSTTSTSYMDPPKSFRKKAALEDASRSLNSTESSTVKRLDPRLLTYIRKLLSMSRASIDDLTVSAASDISTPSPSVLETPNNIPMSQLQTLMKYFNLNASDLQKQLSSVNTSDESDKHYNSSQSVTISTATSDADKSDQYKSCTEIDSANKVNEKASNQKLQQYADIAASCTKKISNLTAMIEKVRAEKRKILLSSTSSEDNDLTVTSYMKLPDKIKIDKIESPGGSLDEEKLGRIDYGYAEKLKQLSSEEIEREKTRVEEQKSKQDAIVIASPKGKKPTLSDKPQSTVEPPVVFAPALFLDIPKLPRLETSSLEEKKKKQRPPPSKGLSTIPRNVAIIPHELSTIIEADSQVSTKLDSPTKTKESGTKSGLEVISESKRSNKSQSTSNSSDDISEMETMETMLISIGMDWAIPTLKKTREALALTSSSASGSKESGELSLREFLSKISSTSQSSSTSSQSQGMSLIEVDNRRTSTPIVDQREVKEPAFVDSDLSSVREQSDVAKDSSEKFYDLNEGSLSKTA